MKTKFFSLLVLLFVLVLLVSNFAFCKEYPTKDIRAICPWAAGGGTDAITRTICHIAEQYLPVSIYVENIEGGQSGLGVYEIMKAKPDGYTIGSLTYDSVVTVPRQNLVKGYDLKKLRMICNITREGGAIVVRADAPWKNIQEFIEEAKNKPGKIKIGVDGLGSGDHLRLLTIEEKVGVEFKVIPYTGGAGPKKEALLSGEIDAVMTSLGDFAPLIHSGEARGLVEMSAERNPQFTDVPTFLELGYSGLVMGSFNLIAVNAQTSEEIIEKLEKVFYDAQHSKEFKDWTAKIGVQASWLNSEEAQKMAEETQKQAFDLLDKLTAEGVIKK